MANTKQAIKMTRKIVAKTRFNRWYKSKIKNATDSIVKALELKTKTTEKDKLYQNLQKAVDKAVKKGVIHKNKGNRIKSRMAKSTNNKLTKTTKETKVKES